MQILLWSVKSKQPGRFVWHKSASRVFLTVFQKTFLSTSGEKTLLSMAPEIAAAAINRKAACFLKTQLTYCGKY